MNQLYSIIQYLFFIHNDNSEKCFKLTNRTKSNNENMQSHFNLFRISNENML